MFRTITRPTVKTFQGREATVTDYRTAGPLSLRAVAFAWSDQPGTVEVKVMKGDGRSTNFTLYAVVQVPADQVEATATELVRSVQDGSLRAPEVKTYLIEATKRRTGEKVTGYTEWDGLSDMFAVTDQTGRFLTWLSSLDEPVLAEIN